MFYFLIERRRTTQWWANINFHKPSLKFIVNKYIKAKQLKSTIFILLISEFRCQHATLNWNTSLNYNIFDLLKNLNIIDNNLHIWDQFHDWYSTIAVLLTTILKNYIIIIKCYLYFLREGRNYVNVYSHWNLSNVRIYLLDLLFCTDQ